MSGVAGNASSLSGTLYAVHHLLRNFGVRFFAWDETYVPLRPCAPASAIDATVVPVFEYRDIDGYASMGHVAENATRSSQADYFHMNGYTQVECENHFSCEWRHTDRLRVEI